MSLDSFCNQSLIIFSDYLYNRSNKKIKCHIFGGSSKQLTSYIEIKKLNSDQEEIQSLNEKIIAHRTKIT